MFSCKTVDLENKLGCCIRSLDRLSRLISVFSDFGVMVGSDSRYLSRASDFLSRGNETLRYGGVPVGAGTVALDELSFSCFVLLAFSFPGVPGIGLSTIEEGSTSPGTNVASRGFKQSLGRSTDFVRFAVLGRLGSMKS